MKAHKAKWNSINSRNIGMCESRLVNPKSQSTYLAKVGGRKQFIQACMKSGLSKKEAKQLAMDCGYGNGEPIRKGACL